MSVKNKNSWCLVAILFVSLLPWTIPTSVAALLTPLTPETYVQVELRVLTQNIANTRRELESRKIRNRSGAPTSTSEIDAIYREFNTNFMEHLRYSDKQAAAIEAWLSDHPREQGQRDSMRRELESLRSAITRLSE